MPSAPDCGGFSPPANPRISRYGAFPESPVTQWSWLQQQARTGSGRFPKFHRVFLGRDPGTLESDIASKKYPQLICSDLRLSNWKFEDWNYGNRPKRPSVARACITRGQSPYKDSGFEGVGLKQNLHLKRWNSHFHREFPRSFGSTNLGREIGLMCASIYIGGGFLGEESLESSIIYIYISLYIYSDIYIYTHISLYICADIRIHTDSISDHMYVSSFERGICLSESIRICLAEPLDLRISVSVCVYIYIYIYIYVYVYIYIYTVCIYIYIS